MRVKKSKTFRAKRMGTFSVKNFALNNSKKFVLKDIPENNIFSVTLICDRDLYF